MGELSVSTTSISFAEMSRKAFCKRCSCPVSRFTAKAADFARMPANFHAFLALNWFFTHRSADLTSDSHGA